MVFDFASPVAMLLEKLSEESTPGTTFDQFRERATVAPGTAPYSFGSKPLNSPLAYFIVESTLLLIAFEG